jgi:hypothetical protein
MRQRRWRSAGSEKAWTVRESSKRARDLDGPSVGARLARPRDGEVDPEPLGPPRRHLQRQAPPRRAGRDEGVGVVARAGAPARRLAGDRDREVPLPEDGEPGGLDDPTAFAAQLGDRQVHAGERARAGPDHHLEGHRLAPRAGQRDGAAVPGRVRPQVAVERDQAEEAPVGSHLDGVVEDERLGRRRGLAAGERGHHQHEGSASRAHAHPPPGARDDAPGRSRLATVGGGGRPSPARRGRPRQP